MINKSEGKEITKSRNFCSYPDEGTKNSTPWNFNTGENQLNRNSGLRSGKQGSGKNLQFIPSNQLLFSRYFQSQIPVFSACFRQTR